MASNISERDAKDVISKLLQMGTVAEYQNEFEMLIKRVTTPESLLKSFYISGLKPTLQCALLRSNTKTLEEAFSLALEAEARFTDLQLWEFLRSNPSTLGEAFFKDRITEAHFEDEQTATAIVNPNDLNIAISNQVLEESILYTLDKVEAVPTSMVATYEEHGCQESVSGSGISESAISGLVSQLRDAKDEQYRAMIDATALKAELNSLQQQVINDDLGIITS
ncbi:hypothetical protein Tco_0092178 [Tanacetum coccineum]